MVSLPRLLAAVALVCSAPIAAVEITDRFEISFDASAPGNCADVGLERLGEIFSEVRQLASAGLNAVKDALDESSATHAEANRLIDAFFMKPDPKQTDKIRRVFKSVAEWLKKGGNVDRGRVDSKPHLFCQDSWLIRQTMQDQMIDKNGDPMTKSDGSPYLLQDDTKMLMARDRAAERLETTPDEVFPYWSSTIRHYMFEEKFGDDPTEGPCSTTSLMGLTVWDETTAAILLCAESMTGRRLGSVDATPISEQLFVNDEPPTANLQTIKSVEPEAQTLYHELFHLMQGDRAMPEYGEEYNPLKMMGRVKRANGRLWNRANAMANPQSYTYVGIAYSYTSHVRHKGKPVEFHTTYCTIA